MTKRKSLAALAGFLALMLILGAGVLAARAAAPNLIIDGGVAYQTVDGFGANLNSAAWNRGDCRGAVDQLLDQQGSSLWRVIVEQTDGWEAANDNADPLVFNWSYYNALYQTPKFKALWGALKYLRSKNQRMILSVMGYQPSWLGSPTLAKEEEWVEMLVSLLYYARHTESIDLPPVSPLNEMDLGHPEGPKQDAASTLRLFQKLSARLDAVGMGDVQLIGPETAQMSRAASYTQSLMSDPELMAKIRTFAYHDYSGGSDAVNATIAGSDYPDRHWLMGEYAAWCSTCDEGGTGAADEWAFSKTTVQYLLQHLNAGANGACVYDALDSFYEHHGAFGYWGQLAYNDATGAYTPRKRFWALAQLHKFVRPGAVRIGIPTDDTQATWVAFYHPATKQVTIVGLNRGGSFNLNGSLTRLPAVSALHFDVTDSDNNLKRLADVPVSAGSFSVTVPGDSIVTLSGVGLADTTPPTAPTGLTAEAASAGRVDLGWNAATDNVAVAGYNVWRNGARVAGTGATSYSDTTVAPDTTYTYYVTAEDVAGNVSPKSTAKSVTTPASSDTTPPTAPTSLGGEAVTARKINLGWKAATDNVGVATYSVWRDGERIAGTTARSYSDTTVLPGTTYSYSVTAEDAAGNISPKSNSVSITTPQLADTTPPSAPSGLTAQATSRTVELTWAAATDNVGVAAYNVWRNDTRLAGTSARTYADTTVEPGKSYSYYVTAQDAAGNLSTKSNTVSVATPDAPTDLTLEAKVNTHQDSPGNSISSPPLSTEMPGELIVACLGTDGPETGGISFKAVTGGGLTWTLRKRVNSQNGSSEIWQAVAQQRLTNVVVTATRSSGSWAGSLTVLAFANADLVKNGAVGGASGSTGTARATLKTTKTGSLVIGVGNDWDQAAARTLPARQTKVDEFLATVGDTFWVQSLGPVAKKRSTAKVRTLSPTNGRWNLALVEIRRK